eukprot:286276-Pleurochrysis_carterae.AAC.1
MQKGAWNLLVRVRSPFALCSNCVYPSPPPFIQCTANALPTPNERTLLWSSSAAETVFVALALQSSEAAARAIAVYDPPAGSRCALVLVRCTRQRIGQRDSRPHASRSARRCTARTHKTCERTRFV